MRLRLRPALTNRKRGECEAAFVEQACQILGLTCVTNLGTLGIVSCAGPSQIGLEV